MALFRGISAVNVDSKGRVGCPARYRQSGLFEKEANFVVTIDTEDPCLLLYPFEQWVPIEASIEALPSFNPATRRIKRLLIGHATELNCDAQGRLLLPALLREHAQIDKKAMLVGQGNKIEIWSETLWQSQRSIWLAEERNQPLPEAVSDLVV